MAEKEPWDRAIEESPPPPRAGDVPPHILLAEGQKKIWLKLVEIEALIKKSTKEG